MKNKKLVIYGIGGFADYAQYAFENDSSYEVVAICLERDYIHKVQASENIIPLEELEKTYSNKEVDLFVAVGNNLVRKRIFNYLKDRGYKTASYVSTKASSWPNLIVGENCFIGEGSVLQPFNHIEDNTIIFAARLGHHCRIGKHTLLSSCTLGGNVHIGEETFVGLNAVIRERTQVKEKNVIGMGVVISSNTQPKAVYASPAFKPHRLSYDDISKDYLK